MVDEIFKHLCIPYIWTSMWYVVVSLKISKLSKSMEIAEKMSWGMVSMYHLCYYHALKWFYDLAVKSLSWQAHWDEIIFEVIFLLHLCSCLFMICFYDFLTAFIRSTYLPINSFTGSWWWNRRNHGQTIHPTEDLIQWFCCKCLAW